MDLCELTQNDRKRWDSYVYRCHDGTFFHLSGWKEVIERAFGHRTFFLYAQSAGQIQGVLPLGYIRSRIFGNALISSPFCVYGGVIAENKQARQALEQTAVALAQRLQVDYLEFRNRAPSTADWVRKDLYVTFRKPIDSDSDKNMLAIPRKQRRMVRQGIKAGLTSEIDAGPERFYEIYATSVRNLGTPVHPRKYFRILKEVFGQNCEILTVTLGRRPIASVMSFLFRDTVLPYYGGSTPEARGCAGNDFMYWEVMRRACERGLCVFDYGRSKRGTGSYNFKKNWGFEPEPLSYEYLLIKAETVPDLSPLNPKYQNLIWLWKRMPLPLTKLIGPVIARNLA